VEGRPFSKPLHDCIGARQARSQVIKCHITNLVIWILKCLVALGLLVLIS
jgi:hypothetical protein